MFPSTFSARRLHSRLLTLLATFNLVAFQVESLEREMRIELTTSSLACWRSSSELFPRTLVLPRGFEPHSPESKSGVRPPDEGRSGSESWVRTNDPLVNSQVLYRLSYPRKISVAVFPAARPRLPWRLQTLLPRKGLEPYCSPDLGQRAGIEPATSECATAQSLLVWVEWTEHSAPAFQARYSTPELHPARNPRDLAGVHRSFSLAKRVLHDGVISYI